jgi:sodium/proline symporter
MMISTPMLVTFLVYLCGVTVIGVVAYRRTKSFDDYILGGRRLGSVVTALSAGASDMSGWLLMGLPGAIFLSGISGSWIAIGLIIGAYLNWRWVAGRLRIHTELNNNSLTLPDYFTYRFEDKSCLLRLLSALIILIFFTVYCASGIVAGARLFESTFSMSYQHALWAGAAATIMYTFLGGFLAVSWTDTLQASLMLFALILTPLVVVFSLGGVETTLSLIELQDNAYSNMFNGLDSMAILSLLGWGLGYFGQPHILARFMAADSHHSLRRARRIGMTWMILCLGGTIAVGFLGIAYFSENAHLAQQVNQNSERVFIELTRVLFNPWIGGILLSAILAAVMSTLSCQLLVCSSALTEDLYKAFIRQHASQQELVWVGRLMVLLVALVAIALAADPHNSVLGLVSYAWAGFGAAFGPVVMFSVLWSGMTRNSALAGMLAGALSVIIWKYYELFGLYEIIPGFIISSMTIIVVSLWDKKPADTIRKRFIAAQQQYKQV